MALEMTGAGSANTGDLGTLVYAPHLPLYRKPAKPRVGSTYDYPPRGLLHDFLAVSTHFPLCTTSGTVPVTRTPPTTSETSLKRPARWTTAIFAACSPSSFLAAMHTPTTAARSPLVLVCIILWRTQKYTDVLVEVSGPPWRAPRACQKRWHSAIPNLLRLAIVVSARANDAFKQ